VWKFVLESLDFENESRKNIFMGKGEGVNEERRRAGSLSFSSSTYNRLLGETAVSMAFPLSHPLSPQTSYQ
jgi:hypothetical protein